MRTLTWWCKNLWWKILRHRDDFMRQITARWNRKHPSYQEFVLQDQLRRVRGDVLYLQDQLTKARADTSDLQRKFQELKEPIAGVLKRSDVELRKSRYFSVQEVEDDAEWEVVTEHCCLGGCDMGVYTFTCERDALIFAALLSAIEYKPSSNIACSTCYAEYMKDCI